MRGDQASTHPGPADATREAELAAAVSTLRGARSVLLLAHNNPDADSLGSAVALALGLQAGGATVGVSFDVPGVVPQSLCQLPGMHLVTPADSWLNGAADGLDLIVALDAGSAERLGRLAGLFGRDIPLLVIDHHVSNTYFGEQNLVDPSADATVALVDELLTALGVPLDIDLATLLYAGLATDTGGFRHGSAGAHRLAARFVESGVDPQAVLRPITDSHPFGWMRMLSDVLGRAELDPDAIGGRGFVHTYVSLDDLQKLRQEEADSVIDILRTSCEASAAGVVIQTGAAEWHVSLRSRGDVLVGSAATALGGGGHPRAAGFTWYGDYDGAIAALTDALHSVPVAAPSIQ